MAKLILTKAEKDAEHYLDWDDDALGKLTRRIMIAMKRADDKEGIKAVMFSSALAAISAQMRECNAEKFSMEAEMTHLGKPDCTLKIKIIRDGTSVEELKG